MDLLQGYGSSDGGQEDGHAEEGNDGQGECRKVNGEEGRKRPREEEEEGGNEGGGGGGGGRKRGQEKEKVEEEVLGDVRERLCRSLRRLLETSLLPTKALASERRVTLDWFQGVCRHEFDAELGGGEACEIVVFGSWTYSMWVPDSDVDINVHTPAPIPKFFSRLRAAVVANDREAKVEVVLGAVVPVARIVVRGLHIDVVHEHGVDNEVARHHIQVREWAKRWMHDEAVCTCMRIVKLWAIARDLHSPMNNTLNSMGYMVMLLAVAGDAAVEGRGEALRTPGSLEGRVADLICEFFSRYAHNLRKGAPRTVVHAPGGLVTPGSREGDIFRLTQAVGDAHSTGFGATMFVQDPFLGNINLARFVDRQSIKRLRAAFAETDKDMREGRSDAFQRLVAKRRAR